MTLPDWASPLPDGAAMRAIDSWAIEERGIASLELMERAGAGVARAAARIAPQGQIVFVLGTGNNGGDGLVGARLLREAGREVEVLLCDRVSGSPGMRWRTSNACPVRPPSQLRGALPAGAALVVDGLLGTGARGAPRERRPRGQRDRRSRRAAVLAIDIPSGVEASSGETPGAAVRASSHAHLSLAKVGLCIEPGRHHAGAVARARHRHPAGRPACEGPAVGLIDERCSTCCRTAARCRRSSRAGTSSSRAARAGSPARRVSPRWARSARGPAT